MTTAKRPTKTGIYLFGAMTVLCALATVAWFLAGRVVLGTIWASLLTPTWGYGTYLQCRTWRYRVDTFEILAGRRGYLR